MEWPAFAETAAVSWPRQLLAEAVGTDTDYPPDLGRLTPEQDKIAIAALCRELRACLADADRSGAVG